MKKLYLMILLVIVSNITSAAEKNDRREKNAQIGFFIGLIKQQTLAVEMGKRKCVSSLSKDFIAVICDRADRKATDFVDIFKELNLIEKTDSPSTKYFKKRLQHFSPPVIQGLKFIQNIRLNNLEDPFKGVDPKKDNPYFLFPLLGALIRAQELPTHTLASLAGLNLETEEDLKIFDKRINSFLGTTMKNIQPQDSNFAQMTSQRNLARMLALITDISNKQQNAKKSHPSSPSADDEEVETEKKEEAEATTAAFKDKTSKIVPSLSPAKEEKTEAIAAPKVSAPAAVIEPKVNAPAGNAYEEIMSQNHAAGTGIIEDGHSASVRQTEVELSDADESDTDGHADMMKKTQEDTPSTNEKSFINSHKKLILFTLFGSLLLSYCLYSHPDVLNSLFRYWPTNRWVTA